ncbi:MAG TPA: molybdopterin-dependent oxidoreductase [Roseiarcus sp.]|jgi:anaerobic selenocysteine-containing dehydrogenase|nr:molybdopterin-dependent oxidoreductase [Roseiarcus sp.]
MNAPLEIVRRPSVCPHDCPSVCALDVEVIGGNRIGRVHGATDHPYTQGVVCAKVARYAERIHHPERLIRPLKRIGPKGSGQFAPISWAEALDRVAGAFVEAEREHGAESVWPYFYAGTMGLVMRDGIERLTHAKRYSRFFGTICVGIAWPGYSAGTGRMSGISPAEMAKSDVIVIWGTNAAATQVNLMTHATRARKEHGAKIVAIDIYPTETLRQADLSLQVRPGTDGALACAVMHVLFRDGFADRDWMARYADAPEALEAHLCEKTPAWASAITGLDVGEIEAFAALVGRNKRTFFRLGYGFSRQRNGAANMHAALCIPAVTGAWAHEGGGALHASSAVYGLDKTLIEGLDQRDESVRRLDMSRIGAVLTGDREALKGGGPVHAMLIQNTNPMVVAPDQEIVRRGFAREDLFVCVHEQFMTDTARYADVVLPATMSLEHDDIYTASAHQFLQFAPKAIDPPEECRSNHEVICGLAHRLGTKHRGFEMSVREIIDETLRVSGRGTLAELEAARRLDCQPPFETAHFLDGFGHPDRKFHFRAEWPNTPYANDGLRGPWRTMPSLPDHWAVNESADEAHPFKLATSPARNFLNSSFNQTSTSLAREVRPSALMHPADMDALGLREGDVARLGNARGEIRLHVKTSPGATRGVIVSEGLWDNRAFLDGRGINTLTSADSVAPFGGAAFHDIRVWARADAAQRAEAAEPAVEAVE